MLYNIFMYVTIKKERVKEFIEFLQWALEYLEQRGINAPLVLHHDATKQDNFLDIHDESH